MKLLEVSCLPEVVLRLVRHRLLSFSTFVVSMVRLMGIGVTGGGLGTMTGGREGVSTCTALSHVYNTLHFNNVSQTQASSSVCQSVSHVIG